MANFKCPFCLKGFSSEYGTKSHIIENHLGKEIRFDSFWKTIQNWKESPLLEEIKKGLKKEIERLKEVLKTIEKIV